MFNDHANRPQLSPRIILGGVEGRWSDSGMITTNDRFFQKGLFSDLFVDPIKIPSTTRAPSLFHYASTMLILPATSMYLHAPFPVSNRCINQ